MLRYGDDIRGAKLDASDGDIGKVKDLYFDDRSWIVRFFLVDAGTWFQEKPVLIAIERIVSVDPEQKVVTGALTRNEVKASPPQKANMPLSTCTEIVSYPHHFWPPTYDTEGCGEENGVPLRSVEETYDYAVSATDGEIGHVAGFIVDDTDWVVRYVEVDTRNLWPGKHVLVSTEWLEEVDWTGSRLIVNLDKEAIKDSPEYDHHSPVTRGYETDLCHFYNREGYWTREPCDDDPKV